MPFESSYPKAAVLPEESPVLSLGLGGMGGSPGWSGPRPVPTPHCATLGSGNRDCLKSLDLGPAVDFGLGLP